MPSGGRYRTCGQPLGEQLAEQPPVAVEVAEDVVQPGAALVVGGGVGEHAGRGRAVAEQEARPRAQCAASSALDRISWAALRPGRFQALDADVAVTVCAAVTADSDGVGAVHGAGVHQRRVDLVGEDPGPGGLHDVGEGELLVGVEHPAERVVRVDVHEQPAAARRTPRAMPSRS